MNWSITSGSSYNRIWADDSNAYFEGSGGTVNVSGTINSVNSLIFGVDGYTLGNSPGSGTITLTGSGGNITIDNNTCMINSTIAGSVGSTKLGSGMLTLAGANAYTGSTAIQGGTLRLSGGDDRLPTGTAVTLAYQASLDLNNYNQTIASLSGGGSYPNPSGVSLGSGTLTINSNTSTAFGGKITGTGNLVKKGSGELTLAGLGTTFTGDTRIYGGTIKNGSTAVLWYSTLDYDNYGGTMNMDPLYNNVFGGLKGNQDLVVPGSASSPTTIVPHLTIGGNDKSMTYGGVLSGVSDICKWGYGTWTLAGANTLSGKTLLASGKINLANTLALQYSTLHLMPISGPYGPNNSQISYDGGTLIFDPSVNSHTFTIGGLGCYPNRSIILQDGSDGTGNPVTLRIGNNNSDSTIAGVLSGSGSLVKIGAGTLALSGKNIYTGETIVSWGTLAYGTNDAIGGGPVTINGGIFNISGYSDTVGTVILDSGSILTGILTSTSGFEMKNGTVSARLRGTGIPLDKTTAGTVTLSGANTYTGPTTVYAGTLKLGLAAHNAVLNLGGADIENADARLVFNYSGGSTPAATVVNLLHDSYAKGWTGGQLRCSLADDAHGLGWIDDPDAKELTVLYAFYGDANLDNSVNLLDLAELGANWHGVGKSWEQGDFNYDGVVNLLDLAILGANWHASATGMTFNEAVKMVDFAPVPEPGTITLLLAGLAGLLGIARKRRER